MNSVALAALVVRSADERCQQALTGLRGLVENPAVGGALLDQGGVEQDPQVAADAALLAFGDQADIADGQLALGVEQQFEDQQAGRVAEGLALAAGADCALVVEQAGAKGLSSPGRRLVQFQIGVSDG